MWNVIGVVSLIWGLVALCVAMFAILPGEMAPPKAAAIAFWWPTVAVYYVIRGTVDLVKSAKKVKSEPEEEPAYVGRPYR